ncbi:hypothetical protein CASFOL_006016 [Castilleja foliolosa]|uniref:Uncharacterized protein n=1 Tax=Castilleja foliolosa TaxID=1961234 RepID=A0ABD3E539_9LAMI
MKGTCALVASAVAVSTVAFTSADKGKSLNCRGGKEKYAPRFDGLKFIETLVTAHR